MARYIDADKLIAHLKDEIKECEFPFGSRANGKSIAYGTALGLKSAISFVETLSTADVVPRSKVANGIITDLQRMWRMSSLKDRIHGMDVYVISQRDYQTIIAEIRKKYTEEKKDEN